MTGLDISGSIAGLNLFTLRIKYIPKITLTFMAFQ